MKTQKQAVDIGSLAEYIRIIEQYNLSTCISRGESKRFDCIQASAFRPFSEYGKYFDDSYINQFYHQIGNDLTEMQKKHFLAFSQHSGLPTFLLDFTTSPLISLFFACYMDDCSENSDQGYVYFIDRKRLLPIDEYIPQGYRGGLRELLKYNSDGGKIDLFDHWIKTFDYEYYDIHCNEAFYAEYAKMIFSFLDIILYQHSEYTYTEMAKELEKVIREIKTRVPADFDSLQRILLRALQKMFELFPNGSYIEDIVRVDGLRQRFHDGAEIEGLEYPENRFDLSDVTVLGSYDASWEDIRDYLLDVAEELLPYSTQKNYYLPFYATYSPPNISGRVNAQNSVFIC